MNLLIHQLQRTDIDSVTCEAHYLPETRRKQTNKIINNKSDKDA